MMCWHNLKKLIGSILVFVFVCIVGVNSANARVLTNATLNVVLFPVGAPQAYLFEDLTKPQGFDVDVLLELQKRLGFRLRNNRILAMDFADGLNRIKNGTADIMIGGLSYSDARAKSYDNTAILFTSSLTVMYNPQRNPNIKSFKDFKGKRVGVIGGSVYEELLENIGAQPVVITNPIETYFQVFYGEIDGYIGDRPPLEDFVRSFNSPQLAVVEEPFGEDYCRYVFVLSKDSPYTKEISSEITRMINDGTMEGLLKFWKIDHCAVGDSFCSKKD